MDLDAWLADYRVVALLELLEQMPYHARWREAYRDDPEHVRAEVARRVEARTKPRDPDAPDPTQDDDEQRIPSSQWTPDMSALSALIGLVAKVAGSLGVDVPPGLDYFAGPEDKVADAMAEYERQQDAALWRRAIEDISSRWANSSR